MKVLIFILVSLLSQYCVAEESVDDESVTDNQIIHNVANISTETSKASVENIVPAVGDYTSNFKTSEDISVSYIMWVLFILVICLFVTFIIIFMLKKYMDKTNTLSGNNTITIVASRRLSTKVNIFVVKVNDSEYIIANSNESISMQKHRDIDA